MVLVFSSIFMGIWNSDQKAMDSTIARNKRLNKPVVVFPMPSVETVQREKMLSVEISVPEQRPVRVAMRASDNAGQNEPVIERHEEQIHQHIVAEDSDVTLTPVFEKLPASQETINGADTIPVGEAVKTVEAVSAESLVSEPVASEMAVPQLVTTDSEEVSSTESSVEEAKTGESTAPTESSVTNEPVQVDRKLDPVEERVPGNAEIIESKSDEAAAAIPAIESPVTELTVSETPVAEIESLAVPAPEDFAVEGTADSGAAKSVTETALTNDVSTEKNAVERVEPEAVVTAEVVVMVTENSTDETVVDQSGDASVQSEQPVAESTQAELPEPANPIKAESVISEPIEDEKSLEEKLLQTGEYDMLNVHADGVTTGSVESALDGGAACIPLPRNLASGTWQVIHSSGEFFRITIDRGRNSSEKYGEGDKDVLETSFCVTTTPDGVRWCFIRSFVDSAVPVRRVTTEFFSPGQQ